MSLLRPETKIPIDFNERVGGSELWNVDTIRYELPLENPHQVSSYPLKPYLFDTENAVKNGDVEELKNGDIKLLIQKHDSTERQEILVSPFRFHANGLALAMNVLDKKLSGRDMTPEIRPEGAKLWGMPDIDRVTTVRRLFDIELDRYRRAQAIAESHMQNVTPFGSLLYDPWTEKLYSIAPTWLHRLALVLSNGNMYLDPEDELSWIEKQNMFENTVIGTIGCSVGGTTLTLARQEFCPKYLKLADMDGLEVDNLQRLLGTLEWVSKPLSSRSEPTNRFLNTLSKFAFSQVRNAVKRIHGQRSRMENDNYETVNKAHFLAYWMNMIDPYMKIYVYDEGIHDGNLHQFLFGDGIKEPRLDYCMDEADSLWVKKNVRVVARKGTTNSTSGHGTVDQSNYHPVVGMVSDFHPSSLVQWWDFKSNPTKSIGFSLEKDNFYERIRKVINDLCFSNTGDMDKAESELAELFFGHDITPYLSELINDYDADFSQLQESLWNKYQEVSEENVLYCFNAAIRGGKDELYKLIIALCGPQSLNPETGLGMWLLNKGTQPCTSLPQPGSIVYGSASQAVHDMKNNVIGHPLVSTQHNLSEHTIEIL